MMLFGVFCNCQQQTKPLKRQIFRLQEVMADPVLCDGDGQTYERAAIIEWLEANDVSYVTKAPLPTRNLIPNHALRSIIQAALG